MTTIASPPQASDVRRTVAIDFLYLICRHAGAVGTDANIDAALAAVDGVLAATGTRVELRRIHVRSVEQARELRFVRSPTIRVNGRDIAPEPLESECGADGCGCGPGASCRLWRYAGRDHAEAPVGLIVDAVLSALYAGPARGPPAASYELPDNLVRVLPRAARGRVLRVTAVADPVVAWSELRGPLARFIARRVADPEDAEDVLQEVLLRIHRHGDELARRRPRGGVGAPDRPQRDHRPLPPPGRAAGAAGRRGRRPRGARRRVAGRAGAEALRRELAACLRPLIERLPESQREALMLTEFEGLTQAEAARRLGISVSGAKTRVQRGRAQLKTLLLDCCHVELDRRGGITEYRARRGSCERCRTAT